MHAGTVVFVLVVLALVFSGTIVRAIRSSQKRAGVAPPHADGSNPSGEAEREARLRAIIASQQPARRNKSGEVRVATNPQVAQALELFLEQRAQGGGSPAARLDAARELAKRVAAAQAASAADTAASAVVVEVAIKAAPQDLARALTIPKQPVKKQTRTTDRAPSRRGAGAVLPAFPMMPRMRALDPHPPLSPSAPRPPLAARSARSTSWLS